MEFTIGRTGVLKGKDNLVAFATESGKFDTSFFSEEETAFIRRELENDSKTVMVNQYDRKAWVQVVSRGGRAAVLETMRKAGHAIAGQLNGGKQPSVHVLARGREEEGMAFAEGCFLGSYQFLRYRKDRDKKQNTLSSVQLVTNKRIDKRINRLQARCEATWLARDLVNAPLSHLDAVELAAEFKKMGKASGFSVTVFGKSRIESLKMGGLLAVNKGSITPPTFTVMEWKPRRPVNKKPVVLVGKGVVYDTGGLSLKPTANSMDFMKSDMAGAAVAGSVMYALAKGNVQVHVIALVPATDNRPDGNAYVPGDVVTMANGMTVEVLNTDAEGRMILADALHYAKRYEPELVLEFSTLTGAAAAAIGPLGIVCMGDASERTKRSLKQSGENVFERLVEFPFWKEYDEMLKSDIADIKNLGGPYGGAITAGRFLSRFTDYPYMHFDIAGPSFLKAADSYRGKGGSGSGVRMTFDFLERLAS